MQRGYTKLFNTIITSTIWQEPDKTRLIWITMLALADQNGCIHASVPGLAMVARVNVDATRQALEDLQAPDPDSRTKDHDGRRIEEIDGGWRILNYAKYCAMMNEEERREYKARWMREKRQAREDVDRCGQARTDEDASALGGHTETQTQTNKNTPLPPKGVEGEIYQAYPRKVSKPAAMKAIRRALTRVKAERLLDRTRAYARVWAQAPANRKRFIPYPATWFNQEQYNDSESEWLTVARDPRQRPEAATELDMKLEKDPLWKAAQRGEL